MRAYGNASAAVVGHTTDTDDPWAGLRTRPWGRSVTEHTGKEVRSPIRLQPLAPRQERVLVARTEPKPKPAKAKRTRPVSPHRAVIVDRHAAGDPVDVIAADLGVTTATVYYHLRQAGTARAARPRSRAEHVDTAAILDRYRAGDSIPTIAEALGFATATVRRRVRDAAAAGEVERRDDRARKSGGRNKRTFTPEELTDAASTYLAGATIADVAHRLGAGRRQTRAALAAAGVDIRPPVSGRPA